MKNKKELIKKLQLSEARELRFFYSLEVPLQRNQKVLFFFFNLEVLTV